MHRLQVRGSLQRDDGTSDEGINRAAYKIYLTHSMLWTEEMEARHRSPKKKKKAGGKENTAGAGARYTYEHTYQQQRLSPSSDLRPASGLRSDLSPGQAAMCSVSSGTKKSLFGWFGRKNERRVPAQEQAASGRG